MTQPPLDEVAAAARPPAAANLSATHPASSKPDLRLALERLAAVPRVLLAADFDGTLAPFTTDPLASRALPGAIEALEDAAQLPGVTAALVSGRDLQTLTMLAGLAPGSAVVLVGSHGAHSSLDDQPGRSLLDDDQRALLAALELELRQVQTTHPQARFEQKPAAVALHTRGVDPGEADAALAAAREVGTRHTGAHVLLGKDVVELAVVQTSKGIALRTLADSVGAGSTAYFGDDVTDERAFEVLRLDRGDVAVKVGDGDTAAAYRVESPQDVVDALRLFVRLRTAA